MRILACLPFCLLMAKSEAQVPVRTDVLQQAMEASSSVVAEREEDDLGREMEADRILHARFSVNQVDPEELARWVGLSPMQTRQFALYRARFGPFIDLMELQAVPGWDTETVRRALPWLRIAAEPRLLPLLKERWENGRHRILLRTSGRWERSEGGASGDAADTGPPGRDMAMLFRYRFHFRNLLQLGLAVEKDPGERLFIGSRGGPFDFQSFHLALREVGRLQSLVLGDFQVDMGQGLIHWQGLAFRKTADAGLVLRQGQGFRPYQGNDENRFHRGMAGGVDIGRMRFSAFIASDRMDGNLVIDSTSDVPMHVTSLQTSGLHRTASEREDRDAFRQTVLGGTLSYRKEVFRASLNAISYAFMVPLMAGTRPADLYDISGNGWANLSIDYGWTLRNMHLFGEVAVDRRGSKAFLQGLLMSLHSKLDLSLVFRDIAPGYRAIHAQAFTEQSAPMNERGLYTGIVLRPHPEWRLDAHADLFAFPAPTHSADRPSHGGGGMVHLLWKPRRHVEMTLRWQSEAKESNTNCEGCRMRGIGVVRRIGIRWQLSVENPFGVSFRSRLEHTRYVEGAEAGEGFAAFAEVRYKSLQSPYSVAARVSLFDTEGYAPRVYAYENDVPFSHSMSALYGRGARAYVLAGRRLGKGGHLALRLSGTGKREAESRTDGNQGVSRIDFRMQLTWEL